MYQQLVTLGEWNAWKLQTIYNSKINQTINAPIELIYYSLTQDLMLVKNISLLGMFIITTSFQLLKVLTKIFCVIRYIHTLRDTKSDEQKLHFM